jgi:SAM-dependent methyltransferase
VRKYVLRADARLQFALQRRYDRRLGVDTSGALELDEHDDATEERIFYAAAPARMLRHTLERLRPGPEDVFVDIGSGKGLAVLVAAQLPYRRVIGVELAADLTRVAERNVERIGAHVRCQQIELVTADALEWEIPADASVVFLYCPFIGEVFDRVIDRVVASHDAHPRMLHIVYGYPFEHNRLVTRERLAVVDVNSSKWPTRPGWWQTDHVFVTYQLVPEGAGPPEPLGGGFRQRRALEHWRRPNDTRFILYPPGGGEPIVSTSPNG